MADSRSQMGFGQMGPQGQAQPGFAQGQFNMMQQQQFAMMQQQQQMAAAQQGNAMMMQQQPMMQQGMPAQQFQQKQQMYPGQMPQQQQMPMGMYMLQGGQYVQAGFPPGAIPGQGMVPPAYTPQMAQDFKVKTQKMVARQAKQFAVQQKHFEAEQKQRLFQDQQRRFKEFSAIGGRKMDADSLIKHIIGPEKTKPTAPPPKQPTTKAAEDEDDGFGDFIQGPSFGQSATAATAVSSQPAPSLQLSMGMNHMSQPQVNMSQAQANNMSPMTNTPPQLMTPPASQTPPARATPPMSLDGQAPVPQTKEEKKDLEKMMFASCDLTAPQKARTFQKRTLVKDAPKQVRTVTYQPSEKARTWGGENEKLTELFTLPAPEPSLAQQQLQQMPVQPQQLPGQPQQMPGQPQQVPGQEQAPQGQGNVPAGQGMPSQQTPTGQAPSTSAPPSLPIWCSGEMPLPDIYSMVLQASVREGRIQTDMVYAILVRSGLPREVLGAIWGMANKTMPGQLLPHELIAVLALIAIAQTSMAMPSMDMLQHLPGPPIPNLGQVTPAADPGTPGQPAAALPTQMPTPQAEPTLPAQPIQSVPGSTNKEEDFEDFQDFQSNAVPPSDSFGDFTAASPVSISSSLPGMASSSTSGVSSMLSPEPLIGDEDKYNAFKQLNEVTEPSKEPLPSLQPTLPTSSIMPTQPDVASFMGKPKEEFADFASAPASDGFPSFQQAPSGLNAPPPSTGGSLSIGGTQDKLSALKALVADKSKYTEQEQQDKSGMKADDGEEWAGFNSIRDVSSAQSGGNIGNTEGDRYSSIIAVTDMAKAPSFLSKGPDDLFGSSKPVQSVKQKELFPADDNETDEWGGFAESEASTNWADFSSPTIPEPAIKPEVDRWSASKTTEWALSSSKNESDLTSFGNLSISKTLSEQPKSKEPEPEAASTKPYSSTTKKYNYFARNLDVISSGMSAGTGMSPLDFQPPDLPDDNHHEDEEDFDKFGTFHGVDPDTTATSGAGISSLGAPFGGIDDVGIGASNVDMFGYSSRPRTHAQPQKDTSDSVSISSNEFTGFKVPNSKATKECDTQSVSSLDLSKTAKSPKDGSPAGGDSQSVSSLEFGAVDRKSVTPADERSIASLELKIVSTPEDAPIDAPRPVAVQQDEGFGEFSSATDVPCNGFKPPIPNNLEYIQKPRAASDLLRQGDLPSIADRYSSLAKNQEDEERHTSEWERCLDKCRGMLEQAAHSFTSITNPALCEEVLHSRKGTQYIQGIIEIYRVACRITEAMKAVSITNEKLVSLLKAIDTAWLNLVTLLSDTLLKPSPGRLDFSQAVLKAEDETAQNKACGVCLLNVDAPGARGTSGDHKLTYGGRQYHAACANFWVNCVDSMLPALKIPELL